MRVMIDPGHGGRDPGASAHGILEKDLTMVYADALFAELRNRGHWAALTRTSDVDLALDHARWNPDAKSADLRRRCQLANSENVDAFVSLHCNAGRSAANGAWALHCKGSHHGAALSRTIFDEMCRIPGISDDDDAREVYPDASPATGWTTRANVLLRSKPAYMANDEWLYTQGLPYKQWYRTIYVLRGTKAPATLLELGFLTNKDDAHQLNVMRPLAEMARAISDGLEGWWDGD